MSEDRPESPRPRRGLVGRMLGGRYRVMRMVSAGASMLIVDAEDTEIGRMVTVKLVRPEWAESTDFRRKFRQAMRAMSTLSHPNIAAIHDWGEETVGKRTTVYGVTEYLAGGSLRDLFDRGRYLDASQALLVGLEACRGLDYAHRKGLVHTELTPSKLVFGDDRRLRIVDFGLARLLGAREWAEPATVATHVARYASPEQALAQPLDGKSDVYSLALILVEAVSREVPFAARSTVATLSARIGRLMPASADLGALAAVLERAGRPQAADRSTAAEFGRSLVRAAEKLPRPAPIPILVTGRFEDGTGELRRPSDPTGGVARPRAEHVAPLVPPEPVAAPEDPSPIPALPDDVAADEDDPASAASSVIEAAAAASAVAAAGDEPAPAGDIVEDDPASAASSVIEAAAAASALAAAGEEPATPVAHDVDGAPLPPADPAGPAEQHTSPVPLPLAAAAAAVAARSGRSPAGGGEPDAGRAAPEPSDELAGEPESVPDVEGLAVPPGGALGPIALAPPAVRENPELYDGDADATKDELAALARRSAAAATMLAEPQAPADTASAWSRSLESIDTGPRRSRWYIALAGFVVLAVLAGLGFLAYVLFRVPTHEVPDLAGLGLEQAQTRIADFGWEVDVQRQRSDDEPDVGQVVRTAPAAGSDLADGEPFLIVVSDGPELRALPDLEGLTRGDAETALAELSLQPAAAGEEFSEAVPAGSVISWSVPADPTLTAGSEVLPGTEVAFVVSSGPASRAVPDLAGLTVEEATAELEALRLQGELAAPEFSNDVDSGVVIASDPAPGTSVERDSTVTLRSSKGPDLVALPDLTGMTLAQARSALVAAGLQPGTVLGNSRGRVVEMIVDGDFVEAGSEYLRNSTVDLALF